MDPILQALVAIADKNFSRENPAQLTGSELTLFMGGTIVCGSLISQSTYLLWYEKTLGVEGSLTDVTYDLTKEVIASTKFIHLANFRMLHAGRTFQLTDKETYWRGKLDDVSDG